MNEKSFFKNLIKAFNRCSDLGKTILKKQLSQTDITISSPKDKWKYSLAYLISRLIGPFPLVCLLWLVTALRSGIGFWKAIWVYPLIFILVIGLPTLITTFLIITHRVKNIEWSDLQQRNKYLLPLVLITSPLLLLLTFLLTNQTLFHLSILLVIIMICVISSYRFLHFKISGHITVATVVFFGLSLYLGLKFLALFILLIPLFWARITLKVHTLKELLAGFLIPTIVIVSAVLLFGWPNVPN